MVSGRLFQNTQKISTHSGIARKFSPLLDCLMCVKSGVYLFSPIIAIVHADRPFSHVVLRLFIYGLCLQRGIYPAMRRALKQLP